MDCDMISYGTGTPVLKDLINMKWLPLSTKLLSLEKLFVLKLWKPLLDTKGNKMAETAFEVLEQITSIFFLLSNSILKY
jgi:arginase